MGLSDPLSVPRAHASPETVSVPSTIWDAWRERGPTDRRRIAAYSFYICAVAVLFIRPLIGLVQHAAQFELHSHIPLVPFVTVYLIRISRAPKIDSYRSSLLAAMICAVAATAGATAALWWRAALSPNDYLAAMTFSFAGAVIAGAFLFLGSRWASGMVFPLSFLAFMIPMPDAMTTALEMASVRGSADVSALFFRWTGTPMLRDANVFALPGIVIQVAQECSGIRSSWVLLITSLVAAHLFVKTAWRRAALVAFVVPLGIVRNAFRILVIGLLCVHVGPHMADSAIHHRGGPLFFVLSLGPLYLFLWWLRRGER